jgi:hypothetical protein
MHLESNTFCPHGGPLQFGEATLDHASPKRSGRNTAAPVVHPQSTKRRRKVYEYKTAGSSSSAPFAFERKSKGLLGSLLLQMTRPIYNLGEFSVVVCCDTLMARFILISLLAGAAGAVGMRPPMRAPAVRMQFDFGKLLSSLGANQPKAKAAPTPSGGLPVPKDTFNEELSLWPTIVEIQEGLAKMPPAEQRRQKLEVGINWPPRTTTEDPFGVNRQGYMFFQGPTPKTSVQKNLPSFLSKENFADVSVPAKLKVFGGLFGVSFVGTSLVLILS